MPIGLEENVFWTGNLTGSEEVNVADRCSSVTQDRRLSFSEDGSGRVQLLYCTKDKMDSADCAFGTPLRSNCVAGKPNV